MKATIINYPILNLPLISMFLDDLLLQSAVHSKIHRNNKNQTQTENEASAVERYIKNHRFFLKVIFRKRENHQTILRRKSNGK